MIELEQQTGLSGAKKILAVDDEPDILEFLQVILEDEGYAVSITSKGDYLETIQKESLPDLILLDVFLSGKDGREIARHLKSRPVTRHIPIIMFSAHPNAESTARDAGANEFIAKPFEIPHLLELIEKYFRNGENQ